MQNRLVYVLVTALFCHQMALCQLPKPQPGGAYQVKSIRLIVLEGENAINYIPTHIGTPPVVEVRDENERPVENATVTFTLPETGPGGAFAEGKHSQTRTTGFQGQAGTSGFALNSTSGPWVIRVTATHQGLTASALIHQTNTLKAPVSHTDVKPGKKWKWIVLGIAAGGGIVTGIYFATRPSNSPISINTGSIIISGPR